MFGMFIVNALAAITLFGFFFYLLLITQIISDIVRSSDPDPSPVWVFLFVPLLPFPITTNDCSLPSAAPVCSERMIVRSLACPGGRKLIVLLPDLSPHELLFGMIGHRTRTVGLRTSGHLQHQVAACSQLLFLSEQSNIRLIYSFKLIS